MSAKVNILFYVTGKTTLYDSRELILFRISKTKKRLIYAFLPRLNPAAHLQLRLNTHILRFISGCVSNLISQVFSLDVPASELKIIVDSSSEKPLIYFEVSSFLRGLNYWFLLCSVASCSSGGMVIRVTLNFWTVLSCCSFFGFLLEPIQMRLQPTMKMNKATGSSRIEIALLRFRGLFLVFKNAPCLSS